MPSLWHSRLEIGTYIVQGRLSGRNHIRRQSIVCGCAPAHSRPARSWAPNYVDAPCPSLLTLPSRILKADRCLTDNVRRMPRFPEVITVQEIVSLFIVVQGEKTDDYDPPSYETEAGGLREDTTRYCKRVR